MFPQFSAHVLPQSRYENEMVNVLMFIPKLHLMVRYRRRQKRNKEKTKTTQITGPLRMWREKT